MAGSLFLSAVQRCELVVRRRDERHELLVDELGIFADAHFFLPQKLCDLIEKLHDGAHGHIRRPHAARDIRI